jgi:hypothetical protein
MKQRIGIGMHVECVPNNRCALPREYLTAQR